MSVTIDTAFINTYKSNVIMLAQQKTSRFKMCVRNERQASEVDFYERIGSVDMQDIVNRHGDSPIMNTPHSRRAISMTDNEYGDLIDKMDRLRMLMDPQGPYTVAAVQAANRKTDDKIIAAALGNAYSGKDGTTPVALPNAQKLAAFDGTTTTGVGLNVKTLVACSKKFDENDVDESINKYFAYSSWQKQDLLNQTEVTNADYNSVQALVSGKVDNFMGFTFIRSQRLARSATNITYTITDGTVAAGTGTITASKSRRCFAWAEDGIVLAEGIDPLVQVAPRPDKRFSTQIYVAMSNGATRLEEEKVVEVICSEN